MGLDLDNIDGQTLLDEDEKDGLLIPTVATRNELDEYEQQNIEQAIQWTLKKSFRTEDIFTEIFLKSLHKRMYGNVWAWAGEFRKTNKNIGVDKWQIPTELKIHLDDSSYWLNNSIYKPDEIAIRFKHRLVSIHCFPNGNGRHSRLMADIIIQKIFKLPVFTWGTASIAKHSNTRNTYLNAIRTADSGNIEPLIIFAKS